MLILNAVCSLKKTPIIAIAALLVFGTSYAQTMPGLPDDMTRDESLPLPSELLGFEPGERHPHHHELLRMYQTLAEQSDRVRIETIGRSHGGRDQVLLYFASPERLANLEAIQAGRQDDSRAGEGPAVVWLGYAVHGNEASAATAAALTAWYLAMSNDAQVQDWLDELVIIMEPMINPDGIDRFAHWVNNHRGRHPSSDPRDREHNEAWPNGRTSYYWFDLNRDWLPLTHPVSQNRLREYHQWRPHLLTDVHEMGHNATYFFQPGVPERNNPATPERVYEITQKIAEFHADILDQAGQPYYTREVFDDYYAGKGSTYPDLTGSVGILFEQASTRGHVMQTRYGERSFAEAIANQVRTSISSLQGAYAHQAELIDYQADFFAEAREISSAGGWVLADGGDPARAEQLLQKLIGHAIEIRPTTTEVSINGVDYAAGQAWVIPARQDQYRLIRSIFDTPTELPMQTFYDVSVWPMHLAYNLPLSEVRTLPQSGAPLTRTSAISQTPENIWPEQAPAWVIPWDQYRAPAVVAALLREGYRVQASKQPKTIGVNNRVRELVRGSVIVHPGIQDDHLAPLNTRLQQLARQYSIQVLAANTGLSQAGIDLGSPNAPVLQPLNPALIVGRGVRANHAGYLWHWFDTRLDQPIAQLDLNWLARNSADLSHYSHLLLPDGSYSGLPDTFRQNLIDYVRGGGQLIAMRNASKWVESLDLGWDFAESASDLSDPDESSKQARRYTDFDQDFARTLIGGSALNMRLDITHPLGFGYAQNSISTFRRGSYRLQSTNNAYAAPGRYAQAPLSAGYLSQATRNKLSDSTALDATRFGRGLVVRMADDYVFRGYWVGTEKILANALMFGSLIESTQMPEE